LKEKVDAKNGFESYVYSIRNSLDDKEKLKDKISEEDAEKIKEAIDNA